MGATPPTRLRTRLRSPEVQSAKILCLRCDARCRRHCSTRSTSTCCRARRRRNPLPPPPASRRRSRSSTRARQSTMSASAAPLVNCFSAIARTTTATTLPQLSQTLRALNINSVASASPNSSRCLAGESPL